MSLERPKRPQNAYWIFQNDVRPTLAKELPAGERPTPWLMKATARRWRAMTEQQRAPYEQKAAELKKVFEFELESFKASGGIGQRRKRGAHLDGADDGIPGRRPRRRGRFVAEKDPDKPKLPPSGGFGVFLKENRAKFVEELVPLSEHVRAVEVLKLAGATWKVMTEEQKRPWVEKYMKLKAVYEEQIKSYNPNTATGLAADIDSVESDESKGVAGINAAVTPVRRRMVTKGEGRA